MKSAALVLDTRSVSVTVSKTHPAFNYQPNHSRGFCFFSSFLLLKTIPAKTQKTLPYCTTERWRTAQKHTTLGELPLVKTNRTQSDDMHGCDEETNWNWNWSSHMTKTSLSETGLRPYWTHLMWLIPLYEWMFNTSPWHHMFRQWITQLYHSYTTVIPQSTFICSCFSYWCWSKTSSDVKCCRSDVYRCCSIYSTSTTNYQPMRYSAVVYLVSTNTHREYFFRPSISNIGR